MSSPRDLDDGYFCSYNRALPKSWAHCVIAGVAPAFRRERRLVSVTSL